MRHPSVTLPEASRHATRNYSTAAVADVLGRPLFIVSAPRSGSHLLFEQLRSIRGFWSIGGESHVVFNAFPHLRAENAGLDSGSLGERHADPHTRRTMRRIFLSLLRDHDGRRYLDRPLHERPAKPRWLEKTPRNALNIPFLLRVFPNASFVYLHREPRGNMSSLIEAWQLGLRTGRFVTFANLPGWDRAAWCFLLPPGWRSMTGRSLAEIAAFQWATSNRAIIDCLRQLPRDRWTSVDYQSLIDAPSEVIARLCRFAELDAGDGDGRRGPLPLSGTTVSPPQTDKWRRHAVEIAALLPQLEETTRQIEALTRSH